MIYNIGISMCIWCCGSLAQILPEGSSEQAAALDGCKDQVIVIQTPIKKKYIYISSNNIHGPERKL